MAGEREEEAEEAARSSTRGMRIKAEDEDEEATKLESSETLAHRCLRRQQSHAPDLMSLVMRCLLSPSQVTYRGSFAPSRPQLSD